MKKTSEIWNSFSETKGEKRAYIVGIGEGIRLKLEIFEKDESIRGDSLSDLVSPESYLKSINKFNKKVGAGKGLEVCSHYIEGIGEGIKICREKGETIKTLNYKQIIESPDIFVKIIDDLYKNPDNENTKISFIIYCFLIKKLKRRPKNA